MKWKWLNEEKLYKIYENGDIYFMPIEKNTVQSIDHRTKKVFVFIIKNHKTGRFNVDKLVYEAFNAKIKKTCRLVHIDSDENNNNLQNLKTEFIKNNFINDDPENWTTLDKYESKFAINRDGQVKTLVSKKLLKLEIRKQFDDTYKNYVYFTTSVKRYRERVDKLVFETFIGELPKDGTEIIHENGDTLDDSIINLKLHKPELKPDFNIDDLGKWVPVIEYEDGYECNGLGQFKNIKTLNIIQPSKCEFEGMYQRVQLRDVNKKCKEYNLHRILYESFLGKKLDTTLMVDHIDQNKLNNNIMNLRATSQSTNAVNRIRPEINREEIESLDDIFVSIGTHVNGYDFSDYTCNRYGQIKGTNKKIARGNIDKGYQLHGLMDKISKKRITMRAHRIVASIFLPNPNNYENVHHKDENRGNNHISNLEWTTQQQNTVYSVGRKVGRYDLEGKLLKVYDAISMIDDMPTTAHIGDACSGKRKTVAGFIWKYL
jgi:hypothetical protein